MTSAVTFIEEIEHLLSAERYSEALQKLQQEGTALITSAGSIPHHCKLLIISASVLYRNNLSKKAIKYIAELEALYPNISDNFEYTFLKSELLLFQSKTDQTQTFIEDAITKRWPDEELHWLKFNLGMTYFMKGDYIYSQTIFQECQDFAESSCNNFLHGCSSYMSGYNEFQRCFFSIAEEYYQRALEFFTIAGKNIQLGNTYKMLSILAYRTGRYSRAQEHLSCALTCYEKCSHKIGIINATIAQGRIDIFLGRFREAERVLLESHDKARACGYKRGIAVSAEFLGELYYHLGRYEEALRFLKRDEALAREIAPRGDVSVELYRRLGEVYLALDRIEEAEASLARALELSEYLHNKYELGTILRTYGLIASHKRDLNLARSYFNEAIVTLKTIQESFELARTYQVSAAIFLEWIEGADLSPELGEQLIREAGEHLLEAAHLYSSHDLHKRAKECKSLLSRIDEISKGLEIEPIYKRIHFNRKWLIGGMLVARSRHMQDVAARIRHIAPSKMPVLISGETGTGKEIVAKLLHNFSDRAKGPFVAVNCAAVPGTVFESELFGHRRGSFTGAFRDRVGLMEQASGGTLFLDEISELTGEQQAKLLRALQEEKIRRIGENIERPIDIRCISASNTKIQDLLSSGKLREDFYYRIRGEEIHLEPLRHRKDDILALFVYYMDHDGGCILVEDGLTDILCDYHWPGNVRELVSLAKGLSLLRSGEDPLRINDLPSSIRDFAAREQDQPHINHGLKKATPQHVQWFYNNHDSEEIRRLICATLRTCNGNRSAAARELGVARSTLYRKTKELGID